MNPRVMEEIGTRNNDHIEKHLYGEEEAAVQDQWNPETSKEDRISALPTAERGEVKDTYLPQCYERIERVAKTSKPRQRWIALSMAILEQILPPATRESFSNSWQKYQMLTLLTASKLGSLE